MTKECSHAENVQTKDAFMLQVIHGKRHFQSLHAKFGLATFILAVIAPLGGLISFRKLGLLQRFPDKLQPRIKWLHRNVSAD